MGGVLLLQHKWNILFFYIRFEIKLNIFAKERIFFCKKRKNVLC